MIVSIHTLSKYYSLLPSSKNDYWLRPFIAYETMGVWQHVQCDTHTQILECLDLIARFLFSETLGNFITMYTACLSSGNVTTLFCCLKNTNEKNECNIFIEKYGIEWNVAWILRTITYNEKVDRFTCLCLFAFVLLWIWIINKSSSHDYSLTIRQASKISFLNVYTIKAKPFTGLYEWSAHKFRRRATSVKFTHIHLRCGDC